MPEISELGRRIKSFREERGITRSKLAHLARVAYTTLAGIENGDQRSLGHDILSRIAIPLRVTVDQLLGLDSSTMPVENWGELLDSRERAVLLAFRSATSAEKREIEGFLAGIARRDSKRKLRGASPFSRGSSSQGPTKKKAG